MRGGQLTARVNLDDGKVRQLIGADDTGGVPGPFVSVEVNDDAVHRSVRVALHNHVIIRQDVPAGIKDDPGAQTAALEMLRRAGFAEMEEMVEEIVIGRVALRAEPAIGNTHRGFRVDVDDGGLDHLCNPRKAVRKLDRRGRRQGLGIGCSA